MLVSRRVSVFSFKFPSVRSTSPTHLGRGDGNLCQAYPLHPPKWQDSRLAWGKIPKTRRKRGCWFNGCGWWDPSTPWKINMLNPKNMEVWKDDVPFQLRDFFGFMLIFKGVSLVSNNWLVVEPTHLKNYSRQIGNLPHLYGWKLPTELKPSTAT